jgi:hypothetical protein
MRLVSPETWGLAAVIVQDDPTFHASVAGVVAEVGVQPDPATVNARPAGVLAICTGKASSASVSSHPS